MAYPPDWRSGIAMSLFAACAMAFIAYANTPFLKVRGRIYAFSSSDRRPDQSFGDSSTRDAANREAREPYGGGVSAAKSWWRAVIMVTIFAFGVVAYFARDESPWLAASSAILVAVVALFFGYRDAALENAIAAGQRIQFVLISVVTVGVFTVLYLGAYHLARLKRPQQGRHS
jgi:hypothetical protein